ncbi:uncharacterized protein CEXT_796221 [Caerostris extrusa]|uniref:V-type proton ATPase subunit S1 n=1 Tax=Caerostris extrusa TaxID=172846 RepID=A0AAV4RLB6_CAEEX|nr:uncharacterized protein CEXT_796221 [Caerostris extrusa]
MMNRMKNDETESVCSFFFAFDQVLSDEVPAIMWNIKGDALHITPASALGKDDKIYEVSLKEILNSDNRILMSLEDFSSNEKPVSSNDTLQNLESFLEREPYMFLSSINNPLDQIHKAHCGVQEIVVERNIDENVLRSISLAFDKSCIVVLHIPDAGIIGSKEMTFKPSLDKTSKNVVGKVNDDHHKFRNLLAYEEEDPNFLNITGCLLMYAENITLFSAEKNVTALLPFPVDTTGSECGNVTTLLQLNFKNVPEFTDVTIKFNFTNVQGSWTTLAYVEASDINNELNPAGLEAPIEFSYSCGKYEMGNKNISLPKILLSFDRFQVQPFKVNNKFSDSFDCVPFFTVPIWMGIFVALLAIAIVNVGVYALFSIHTIDRFDDPKGKTISVAAGVD